MNVNPNNPPPPGNGGYTIEWLVAKVLFLQRRINAISGGGSGNGMVIGDPVVGATPNMFLTTDGSSNLSEAPGVDLAIGDPITDATPTGILRTDGSGNLADTGMTYTDTIFTVNSDQGILRSSEAGVDYTIYTTGDASYAQLSIDDANTTGGIYYNAGGAGEHRIAFEGGGGVATIKDGTDNLAFVTDISDYVTSLAGVANGLATLGAGGTVPLDQLPFSVADYLGAWDADTNTPTLADGVGNNGDFYTVSVAGTQDLGSGNITFAEGNIVIYNGTIWQKSGGLATGTVTSVSSADTGRCTVANGSSTPVIDIISAPKLQTARTINGISFDGTANILLNSSINAQTGTTYTFVLTDNQKVVTGSNALPQTYTVPPNASVAFPIGAKIDLVQKGTAAIIITPGAGVTINSFGGLLTTEGQFAAVTLIKEATNTWYAFGRLV